jgi:hypothetical protein
MNPAPTTPPPATSRPVRRAERGFFSPRLVRTFAFYTISLCIVASVVASILAIWEFTKKDSLWRLVASFAVIGTGTALFAFVNRRFGEDTEG